MDKTIINGLEMGECEKCTFRNSSDIADIYFQLSYCLRYKQIYIHLLTHFEKCTMYACKMVVSFSYKDYSIMYKAKSMHQSIQNI